MESFSFVVYCCESIICEKYEFLRNYAGCVTERFVYEIARARESVVIFADYGLLRIREHKVGCGVKFVVLFCNARTCAQ